MSKKTEILETEKAAWETMDLKKAMSVDLDAAIAFLNVIRSNPEVLDAVYKVMEDWRQKMIKEKPKSE